MNYELDNGRTINIPDAEIAGLQKANNISFNEAVYLWLCDEDYIQDSEEKALSDKAKKNRITATIHQASAEDKTAKKVKKTREKKENPLKKQIILALVEAMRAEFGDNATITATNAEKYVDIVFADRNFTINLVEHRKK